MRFGSFQLEAGRSCERHDHIHGYDFTIIRHGDTKTAYVKPTGSYLCRAVRLKSKGRPKGERP